MMTPTSALGMSIRVAMFELRETGDWDFFEPAQAQVLEQKSDSAGSAFIFKSNWAPDP